MKPIIKWLAIPLGVVAALAAGGVSYLFAAFPKAPAPSSLKVAATPELLERGKYLANHVSVCMDCHAVRDWSLYSGPPKPGTLGHGGEHFTREMGLPGDFYSRNITPGGVGNWTDGELARAITTGITKDGRAMFPIMPYTYYRHLCEQDLHAIIAYVRTLTPTDKTYRETELDFPVSLIVRTIPDAPAPFDCGKASGAERGKYLTTIAGCPECHTNQDKGRVVGEPFAGGWRFPLPTGGHVTSKNITPDPETGIGKWTKEMFVATFQSRGKPEGAFPVKPGQRQTLMPWNMYGGMTAEDLGAIYDYLKTVPAVRNQVADFEPG